MTTLIYNTRTKQYSGGYPPTVSSGGNVSDSVNTLSVSSTLNVSGLGTLSNGLNLTGTLTHTGGTVSLGGDVQITDTTKLIKFKRQTDAGTIVFSSGAEPHITMNATSGYLTLQSGDSILAGGYSRALGISNSYVTENDIVLMSVTNSAYLSPIVHCVRTGAFEFKLLNIGSNTSGSDIIKLRFVIMRTYA
jgi:hypothetical protein